MATPKIYLDVCCWNRPFDDQTQTRVHLEAEAILSIVARIESGGWLLVSSEAVDLEVAGLSDSERRERTISFMPRHREQVVFDGASFERATELEQLGFRGMDALHLAAAERASADVLLTTDDGFLRVAKRELSQLQVAVENRLIWLQTMLREKP